MVIVPDAIMRHKGLLVDNTTKIELHLPELSPREDAELVGHTKMKSAAVIIMDPNQLEAFMDVINQARAIKAEPDVPELAGPADEVELSEEDWETNAETGFDTR